MKITYVAGPYRSDTVAGVKKNIQEAEFWGMEIVQVTNNVYPIIPHTNTAHWEGLRDDTFFLYGTLEAMRRCDAVFACPGWEESKGTKGEIEEANKLGIPVFFDLQSLIDWSKNG